MSILGQVCCESRLLTLGQVPGAATGGATSSLGGSTADSGGSGGVLSSDAGGGGGGSDTTFREPQFSSAELVTELAADLDTVNDENPTLTGDMLEIFFTSMREDPDAAGAEDVWVARRDNGSDEFGDPVLVTTVNTSNPESSPSISLDGQTLWIGVKRTDNDGYLGERDIWRFARTSDAPVEFGTPVLEANVNSTADDIPRPLGNGGLTMPFASRRDSDYYVTYMATRTSTTAAFGTPTIVEELLLDGYKTTDAFLTNDGLELYFVRGVDDLTGDIYVAHRDTTQSPFGEPIALSTVNTDYDERDPWLSPDGSVLYFVSDRSANRPKRIYRAERVIP
jgi:hypothetical protein